VCSSATAISAGEPATTLRILVEGHARGLAVITAAAARVFAASRMK
jgi:hypothetical protein